MNAPVRAAPSKLFTTANPHALATILEASETKRIIASRDIFDLNGIKLWARDQPVSGALQRKLLDRQLRNPLETCLAAEDGVTAVQLLKAVEALVESDTPLAAWVRPHAARLAKEAAQIPLHSVVQLLLTAAQASRPEAWQHALDAMVLAGALMASHGGSGPEVRIAMLGGLTHDLGEVYIDPRHGEADADRTLDFTSYQQLVVHPHVSQLLLTQLTNYPASLARAVGEHHERGDGSGYPHALRRDAISPLGRLLAVTEAALGVLRGQTPQLARVSVALRVVPGEFDLTWVGRINDAMITQPPLSGQLDLAQVQTRLTRLGAAAGGADPALEGSAEPGAAPARPPARRLVRQRPVERRRRGRGRRGRGRGGGRRTLLPPAGHQPRRTPVRRRHPGRRLRAHGPALRRAGGDHAVKRPSLSAGLSGRLSADSRLVTASLPSP
jgi:HD domain